MGFPNRGEGGGGGPRNGKNSHIFPFFLVEDVPQQCCQYFLLWWYLQKKLQIVGDIYTQNWSIWGKFLSRPLPRGCLALNLALPVVPKHQNQANTTCGASSQPDLIHSDAHVQIFWHSRSNWGSWGKITVLFATRKGEIEGRGTHNLRFHQFPSNPIATSCATWSKPVE